jgi:hypothetical protein
MELKLFTPALLEEARRDVMHEAIVEYRLKFHEVLKRAPSANHTNLLKGWNYAEKAFRENDFDGLALQAMMLNAYVVMQWAKEEADRQRRESDVLAKRLKYTVRLKFEEAETEEDLEAIQRIVDEISTIDVKQPHYLKKLKSILMRLEAL